MADLALDLDAHIKRSRIDKKFVESLEGRARDKFLDVGHDNFILDFHLNLGLNTVSPKRQVIIHSIYT